MPPKRYFEQQEAASDEVVSTMEASTSAAAAAAAAAAASSSSSSKGPDRPKATLFVSRLPFTATTTDLQTLFSDVGPLRRAFVVTDPTTKISKGVGYVTFAVPEDAERALNELQGRKLDGKRAMTITWADAKPTKAEQKLPPVKRPRVQEPRRSQPRSAVGEADSKDPDAVRTVILSGLASCSPAADAKTLYKRARKIGDVENVIYPLKTAVGKDDVDVAHVIFRTPNHAATAVTKLHAHTFKGALVSAVLKKRADGAARLSARMRPETKERLEKIRQEIVESSKGVNGSTAQLPRVDTLPVTGLTTDSRLIIRNLPWDVTASDLRAVFLAFGPIYKIDVPQQVVGADKGKTKETVVDTLTGTDSVATHVATDTDGMEGDDDEEEPDAESDGESNSEEDEDEDEDEIMSVGQEEAEAEAVAVAAKTPPKGTVASAKQAKGRGFAFVWFVSRSDAERALSGVNGRAIRHGEAEKAAAKAAKGSKGRFAAREALKLVRDNAQPERTVAVDWALSKDEWKKKEEAMEAQQSEAEDDGGDGDAADGALSQASNEEDSDAVASDEDDEDEDEDEEAQKPALPTPSEGTTLFVRNLPFEASETELLTLFKQFGPVRYARITMDRNVDPPRSKGTGFVCFWNKEHAIAALQRAREVEEEAGIARTVSGTTPGNASNPFSMTSVLTADPSAPLTASFNVRGRILNVIQAVEREKADSLTVAGQKARNKLDKRNTYLMREGVPLPGTPLASQLEARANGPAEIDRRLASFTQRKSQLNINPSLFISKTRLSVRHLPLFVTDRSLKRLAIHAIKSFKAEAKEGSRIDLDVDELADKTMSPAVKAPKKGERPTSVIQAKIVRALDRPDALTGIAGGRSKGFGFLEMRTFGEALRVVRWANANADLLKVLGGWYVDELKEMKEKLQKDLSSSSSPSPGSASVESKSDLTTRLHRITTRLSDLVRDDGQVNLRALSRSSSSSEDPSSSNKDSLLVEFAIENATVVKKRRERVEQNQRNAERRKEFTTTSSASASTSTSTSTSAPSPSTGRRPTSSSSDAAMVDVDVDDEDDEDEAEGRSGGRRGDNKRLKRRDNWNVSTKVKSQLRGDRIGNGSGNGSGNGNGAGSGSGSDGPRKPLSSAKGHGVEVEDGVRDGNSDKKVGRSFIGNVIGRKRKQRSGK